MSRHSAGRVRFCLACSADQHVPACACAALLQHVHDARAYPAEQGLPMSSSRWVHTSKKSTVPAEVGTVCQPPAAYIVLCLGFAPHFQLLHAQGELPCHRLSQAWDQAVAARVCHATELSKALCGGYRRSQHTSGSRWMQVDGNARLES